MTQPENVIPFIIQTLKKLPSLEGILDAASIEDAIFQASKITHAINNEPKTTTNEKSKRGI